MIEGDLTLGGEHTMQYTDDVLYRIVTWNLYNFINQCNLNTVNKKFFKKKKERKVRFKPRPIGSLNLPSFLITLLSPTVLQLNLKRNFKRKKYFINFLIAITNRSLVMTQLNSLQLKLTYLSLFSTTMNFSSGLASSQA